MRKRTTPGISGRGPWGTDRTVSRALSPRRIWSSRPTRITTVESRSVKRVVLKFTGGAGLTELLSGNIDAVTNADPVEALKVAADPRFHVYHSVHDYIIRTIHWNNADPLFADRTVRAALTLALNRRALLAALNLPETVPITDGVYTVRQMRRGDLTAPLPYDPDSARALLAAAGWHDRGGDGLRERDGQRFRFTAILPARPAWQDIAVLLRSDLARVGVRMDLHPLPGSIVRERVRAGDYEAAFSTAGNLPATVRAGVDERWYSPYRDPAAVKLADAALASGDPDVIDSLYREISSILQDALPITRLFPQVGLTIAHRRISGLSPPFRSADPVMFMDDLWVEVPEKD